MDTRREKLEALKKEKNAVIMAHYYVPDEVQEIADYIGDSYYLSDVATKVDASVIVLCGVRFMGARWLTWQRLKKSRKSGKSTRMWLSYAMSIPPRN